MRRGKPRTRRYRRYSSGDAGAVDLPIVEHHTPTRAPTFESDVIVPFMQALLLGLVIGSAVALIAWAGFDVDPWPWWPVCVAVVAGLALLQRLASVEDTLWQIESFLDVDLDGDDQIGEPPPASHWPVTISGPQTAQAKQEAQQQRFFDEFSAFIRGCELNTSARRWEKKIGRERYTAWRDKLIQLGWAEWNSAGNPQQGWALSHDADEIIEAVGFQHFSRQFVSELT